MKVSTVLLPIKEKRFNPLTQREELVETGLMQEYSAGRPIGQPVKAPTMAPVPQQRAATSSMLRGQEGYHSAALYSEDTRTPAARHAYPGESEADAAYRLASSTVRFDVVPGTNRAEVRVDANFIPFLAGNG